MSDFLHQLPQQLINGLSLGTFYALIALGYTMVYGVLRFINFAHGDVFMIGAFVGYYSAGKVVPLLGGHYVLLGLLGLVMVAMVVCAALGIVIEKLAYRPLRSRPKLTVLITAIGVSLLLEYGGQFAFGPDPKPFLDKVPDAFKDRIQDLDLPINGLGDLILSYNQVLVFGVTIFLLIALSFIVKRTKMGMAMRAVSNNATAAALMGVNTDTVISFTFGLGSALAGAAGILFAISYPTIDPLMGPAAGDQGVRRGGARRNRKYSRRGVGRIAHRRAGNTRRRVGVLDVPRRDCVCHPDPDPVVQAVRFAREITG